MQLDYLVSRLSEFESITGVIFIFKSRRIDFRVSFYPTRNDFISSVITAYLIFSEPFHTVISHD